MLKCYDLRMKRMPSNKEHPLATDSKKFREALVRSIANCTAIETGESISSI
jgi:hypothetical protein